MFYVGTRKQGANTFDVALDAHPIGWANDIAYLLREFGQFEEVRVFPKDAVDALIGNEQVTVTRT
jgi:hypothetical protein